MRNNKVLLSIIGIAVLVVALSGVTLAFFNYTRTGSSNNFNVGRIYFRTTQDGNINLTNVFPISSEDLGTDTLNHDSVTINIEGDTTYSEGVEYLITFDQVNNEINNKRIPISFTVTYEDLGEASDDYYNERGSDESVYLLTESGEVKRDGKYIVVGYIAPGQTGIDGNITISAYLDKDKIAISDTYPETEPHYIVNPNMTTEELNACVSYFEELWDIENNPLPEGETLEAVCNGTGTVDGITFQESLDNNLILEEYLEYLEEHNIIIKRDYSDGTTNEWVNGRSVFTTSEWNSFQISGVSFKVRAEANEGVWVEPEATPASCFTTSTAFKTYTVNPNMTQEEINTCVSYLTSINIPATEQFCSGTGKIDGPNEPSTQISFQELLYTDMPILKKLEEHNVIIDNGYEVSIDDYDASCGSEVVIPSKINAEYKTYTVNPNMTEEELNTCVSYLTSVDIPATEQFCSGTGKIAGSTNIPVSFQEFLDNNLILEEYLEYLEEQNIIKSNSQTVNASIIGIGFASFNNKGLTSVTIPNGVRVISGTAFSSNQLTNVEIPNSVVFINDEAFSNNNLSQIIVPDVYFDNNSDWMCKENTLVQLSSNILNNLPRTLIYNAEIYPTQIKSRFKSFVDEDTKIINASGDKYCSSEEVIFHGV